MGIKSPWIKDAMERPLTADTEFLISIYTYRGETPRRIAMDLNRTERQVKKILDGAKKSGRYDKHIKRYLKHKNDVPHRHYTDYIY